MLLIMMEGEEDIPAKASRPEMSVPAVLLLGQLAERFHFAVGVRSLFADFVRINTPVLRRCHRLSLLHDNGT